MKNIEKYKKDYLELLKLGNSLLNSLIYKFDKNRAAKQIQETLGKGDKVEKFLKSLPDFSMEYQRWYSEAKAVIKQLLPDRYDDFKKAYEVAKNRKLVTYDNYVIEDYLRGTVRKFNGNIIVDLQTVIPVFRQQLKIFESLQKRFESSLFEIEQIVQADLYDTELESARQLVKNKFFRAGGIISGVVLEKHLKQVCISHSVKVSKSKPTISDLNDYLKKESILDVGTWRNIQRLGDLRNLCGHDAEREPNKDDLDDLINGVDKIIKTIY